MQINSRLDPSLRHQTRLLRLKNKCKFIWISKWLTGARVVVVIIVHVQHVDVVMLNFGLRLNTIVFNSLGYLDTIFSCLCLWRIDLLPKTANTRIQPISTYLTIFWYSSSLPSFHLRYMTEASTLAGDDVLGSLRSEMTDKSTVLTFWVGFHRSQASSP